MEVSPHEMDREIHKTLQVLLFLRIPTNCIKVRFHGTVLTDSSNGHIFVLKNQDPDCFRSERERERSILHYPQQIFLATGRDKSL